VRVGVLFVTFLKESKTNNLSNGVLDSESYQVLKKKLLLLLIEIASKGGIFFSDIL